MEYNVFRDYCKAENSEDEEVNHDLQSRLYAEIYYTPNNTNNVDTKTDIKLETTDIRNDSLNISTSRTSNFDNISMKSSFNKSYKEACSSNDSVNNPILTQNEDKPHIKSTNMTNKAESLSKDTNNERDLNVPCTKTLKRSDQNTELSKNNKQLTMCHNIGNTKNSSGGTSIQNIKIDVKSEVENENIEELNSLQHENNEITANLFIHQTSAKINNKKCQEVIHDETDNIFKKYEFSKSFINKLYLEKYEKLTKKLEKREEEKKNTEEQEQAETDIEGNEGNQHQQQSNKCKNNINEVEIDTKCDILSKTTKVQDTVDYSEEITVLLSESESDSEESILEVPIPPKPLPPVINLQDSDESSEASSSDTDGDEGCSFEIENENNLTKHTKKKTATINERADNINHTSTTEDIILNCTNIQKGASNIREIVESSKTVQLEQVPDKNQSLREGHKSVTESEIHSKNHNKFDSFTSNEDNASEFQLPPKTIDNSNVVYERDKNETINFAEDIMIANFVNPNETTSNRKRHREDDNEPSTSAKQGTDTGNESKRSKTSPGQHKNKDKDHRESWEEYFFRPMSEKLKTFYNESRGQENFDVQEIQSKMSKDPRLWAILDEDLMPDVLKRHRYWNMKCANCHQQGHQRYNCPEIYKPIRCHICGTQGHTETRCPQKMCLTCGRKQGTFRKTCESCRTLYCNMCNAVGHKSTECPDLWRRFHQTTTSEINIPDNLSEVMKPADLLYCCNCTKRGHDSSTCNEYRWSQHFPTPVFVSNYIGGPGFEVPIHTDTTEDVIPLTKTSKNRQMTFFPDKTDLEGCNVIYSYGTFYTKTPNGEEVKRKLLGEQVLVSHLTGLLKKRVFPTFLDQLIKMIKFEIKIYYTSNKDLMIRIRSIANFTKNILALFVFWLKLDDEDKRLSICVNFPRASKTLLKMLTAKIEDLDKDLQDPLTLTNQIQQLRAKIANTRDSGTTMTITKRLVDLRTDLLKVFHTKPRSSEVLLRFKKNLKYLKNNPCVNLDTSRYLNIVVIYNKVFLPRTLTNVELQRFLKRYYKHNPKQKENTETKKQKKNASKLTPYDIFLANLQRSNSSRAAKNISDKTNRSEACSSKHIEEQDKNVCNIITTSDKNNSTNNSNQPDIQVITHNTENIFVETHNIEQNVTESTMYPIESVEVPHNQNIIRNETVNTAPKANLKTISPNLITIPLIKSTHTNVSTKASKTLPCAEANSSESNPEKQSETANSSNDMVKTDNSQQDDTISSEISTKKKKSKKIKKAKLDLENNSGVTDDQISNIDMSLENKANQIINEALEFNVPYMNKAVEEVRKRINDKNLKQEHIDTLQRLINLEKDHRKYVSSFCNYLQ